MRAPPQLTIAIAMMGHGPVPELPAPQAGVVYDLHLQSPPEVLPTALQALVSRADVRLFSYLERGAARSRNGAIAQAQGEILLLSDDDIGFLPQNYGALIAAFAEQPDMDILCGRLVDEAGAFHKAYGPAGAPVRFWNAAKVGTPEIALRLARIKAAGVQFDPRFGAGAQIAIGDEYIFLMDCRRAGLRGRHSDLILGRHRAESSGLIYDAAGLAGRRRLFQRALGWFWWPAFALFRWKNRHRLGGGA